jgi:hypothetical protein
MVPPPLPQPPFAQPAPPPPQLSPQHLAELQAAAYAGRKVRRASRVAAFDGWTIGAFGALTLLVGITDISSILIGAVMIVIAVVEIRGGARLRRLEPDAARVLGWNQVALAVLLLGYAGWRLLALRHGDGGVSEALGAEANDPQVREMLAPVAGLTRMILVWVYVSVAAIAVVGPGSMALYYFTRGRHVRAYLEQTPEWITSMQRAGVTMW